MGPTWVVAFVLLGLVLLAVIVSRLELAERFREKWRREIEKDEKTREGAFELKRIGKELLRNKLIEWLVYGVVVKTIWSWRKAPAGTFQKLIWDLVLVAGIAFGIWIIFSMFDARLNRSRERLPDYRKIRSESATE